METVKKVKGLGEGLTNKEKDMLNFLRIQLRGQVMCLESSIEHCHEDRKVFLKHQLIGMESAITTVERVSDSWNRVSSGSNYS